MDNYTTLLPYDTIAAISTAVSEAGIGIIRISGPDALSVADRVCILAGSHPKKLKDVPSHTIHYGFVADTDDLSNPSVPGKPVHKITNRDPKEATQNIAIEKPKDPACRKIIDEVLISVLRAPRSFTAEDTVEINCHGGVYALRRCLEVILKNGARAALPGEFTKRAFLNGRIDLSSAEAVMDVIQAKSEYALISSLRQVKGSLFRKIQKLRAEMLHEAAYIEAALDDPEHYSLDGYAAKLLSCCDEWICSLEHLIRTARDGRLIREGINTAIIGKPNAGKSSLLNYLMGEELAIVTDIAGTTRDVMTQTLRIGDLVLNLADTAGIREASDLVEQIGIDRALERARESDLILYIADASEELDEWDQKILGLLSGKKIIALLNKSDLPAVTSPEQIRLLLGEGGTVLSVSALEGTGIDELKNTITEMFFAGGISFNDEVIITNVRHKQCLMSALESLKLVRESLLNGCPEDICAIDLADAISSVGEITGETMREDLINEIFGKFCMGK